MRLEIQHNLSRKEAIAKIDRLLEAAVGLSLPAGVKTSGFRKTWNNSRVEFEIQARKGFFSATIRGEINADEEHITFELDLPPIVRRLVSEDEIRKVFAKQAAEILKP